MKYIEFEEIDSTNTYIHDHYQELDDDTIVCINYDSSMGNTYDWWDKKDCIESEED